MRRAVIVAAFSAALFVSSAFGDGAKPSFVCKPMGGMFHCVAKNIDGLHPKWTLLKRGGDYIAWGPEFKAKAPKRWSRIQMFVQTDENKAWLVDGGEVRMWRGEAKLRCRPEANCFMSKGPK
jgi:hypothetical protein